AVLKPGITLYLIRHGETDWNRAQRYQGQRDIPLNDTGRAQARRNGAVLKGMLPEIAALDFVSSPLSRAVETMELLRAEMGLDPKAYRHETLIRELHYGHWEGHLQSELAGTDPEGVAAKALDPFGWRPRNGESYADLTDRITPWIAALSRDTVAITHGGVSRVARGAILNLDTKTVPTLEVPQDKILVLRNGAMRWM
ncbi:MAG: histidine phosphatase family protein, partial [Hyphomicrobium sp.]